MSSIRTRLDQTRFSGNSLTGLQSRVGSARFVSCFAALLIAAWALAILTGPIVNGHDTYVSFTHIQTWAAALKAGDLMSTWTPLDANGFGSPIPFFYHKLFNIVAAALTLLTGDIVTGFRLAALLFAAIMLYGMCECAARLGADRSSQWVIGIACVLSPYAVICLIQRGAVAEYSAMALIPSVIARAMDLVTAGHRLRRALELFALLVLLALAHLVIFIAAVGMLFVAALCLLARSVSRGASMLAATGTALVLFVGLIYVPFTVWGAYFSPAQAQLHGLPADNAVALLRIFSPMPGSWFGWPILALLVGIALQLRYRRGQGQRAAIVLTLAVTAFVMTLGMTRLAAPLWRASEQFYFVQFPWRLLSITTPMIFVAFAGMLEQLPGTLKRWTQIGLLMVTVLNVGGGLHALVNVFTIIPANELRHPSAVTGPGPDAGGEYFPARYQQQLAASPDILAAKASSVLPARRPLVASSAGCEAQPLGEVAYFRTLQIHAVCHGAGTVEVSQFDTPFLAVSATRSNDGSVIHPLHGGPFIELPLVAGDWTINVRQRGYLELVWMGWERKLGLYKA
jgi:hypothetical protein